MKRLLLASALSVAALSAQASDLDYNYAQVAYDSTDVESTGLDGFAFGASIKFNDSFYGTFNYKDVDGDLVELSETNAGIGFIKSTSDKTDWVTELSLVRWNIGTILGDLDDNGYRVATGLRGMASDKLELNGKVNYTDVGDFGNGFGVSLGAVYHVNDTFGLTAGYDFADIDSSNLDSWTIGARINF